MFSDFHYLEEFKKDWNKKVKKMRIICLLLGLFMIIAGLACFFFPVQTFQVMKSIVSMIFILFGICAMISYCMTSSFFKDPIIMMIGIIHILFGLLLWKMPKDVTAMSLTMILAILLLFYGAQKISFSRKLRFLNILSPHTYTLSGITTIILAIVFMILPLTSALVINYIIAIYLIVDGITLVIEAINMKQLEE
ncbi:MAG: HdeD family acid-resistance protein [Faecalibacillus sp.]